MKKAMISKSGKELSYIVALLNNAVRSVEKAKAGLTNIQCSNEDFQSAWQQVESIVLRMRKRAYNMLKADNNVQQYYNLMAKIAESVYNISLNSDGAVYRLTLPCLLPHTGNNYNDVISEPLHQYLVKNQQAITPMKSAVVVAVNYSSGSLHQTRDNDNYEFRRLFNVLALSFLPDDGAERIMHVTATCRGDCDSTEIFIIPPSELLPWFSGPGNFLLSYLSDFSTGQQELGEGAKSSAAVSK